jgi:ribosomal protein L39E
LGSRKEKGLKDYLIAIRKKSSSGISNAPVWVTQKKGERVWNPKAKRHWRSTTLGKDYEKMKVNSQKALRRMKRVGKNKK